MNALAELGCGVLARRGALVIDIDVCRGSLETQAQHVKTKLDKYLYSQEAAYA